MNLIFGISRYEKQTTPNKNWEFENGDNLKLGPPKFKFSNL